MVKQQAFNEKIGRWVIFDFKAGKGFKALDQKQKKPCVPFVGIEVSPGSVKFLTKKSKKCKKNKR